MTIAQPNPPPVPVISLEDRMKTWPILAAHRMEEIEKVLLSFERRLIGLEPKSAGKSIFAPSTSASAGLDAYHAPPFVPISPPVPIPGPLPPVIEPSTLPTPSYAQSEQFAGKSIFAPPQQAAQQPFTGVPQGPSTAPQYTPSGNLPDPVQPTIFAPVQSGVPSSAPVQKGVPVSSPVYGDNLHT